MRFLPYLLYLFFIAMHEVIWRDVTSIYGANINLAVFIVVAVALYKEEMVPVWFGFFAGAVLGAGNPGTIGWHAAFLALIGLAAYHIRERLNLESLYARLLLIFVMALIHNFLRLLIEQNSDLFYMFWTSVITGALYTTLLMLLFLAVKDRHITVEKLKAIF